MCSILTYDCSYLPIVEKKSNESDDVFVERLQTVIAEKLSIAKTNFTALDKVVLYEERVSIGRSQKNHNYSYFFVIHH